MLPPAAPRSSSRLRAGRAGGGCHRDTASGREGGEGEEARCDSEGAGRPAAAVSNDYRWTVLTFQFDRDYAATAHDHDVKLIIGFKMMSHF